MSNPNKSNNADSIASIYKLWELPAIIHAFQIGRNTAMMCGEPKIKKMFDDKITELEEAFPREVYDLFEEESWIDIGRTAEKCVEWTVYPFCKGHYSWSWDRRFTVRLIFVLDSPNGQYSTWFDYTCPNFKGHNERVIESFDDPLIIRLRDTIRRFVHMDALHVRKVSRSEESWQSEQDAMYADDED